jgi:hypothetical protein
VARGSSQDARVHAEKASAPGHNLHYMSLIVEHSGHPVPAVSVSRVLHTYTRNSTAKVRIENASFRASIWATYMKIYGLMLGNRHISRLSPPAGVLEHLQRCRLFSSKLNFRFGNDKTFSNGPFFKSKVWIWTKICPKWRTLGKFLAQTVLWASFWTNSFPAKRAHLRLFPTGYARWAPSRGIAPRDHHHHPQALSRPSQGTPSSLPARHALRPRQQLPRMAGGRASAAAGADSADMGLGWNQTLPACL